MFKLKLNLRERRLILKNQELQTSYLVKYKTYTGGIGQTYVFAKTDHEALLKSKLFAQNYGDLISIIKSSEFYYNHKIKQYVKVTNKGKNLWTRHQK